MRYEPVAILWVDDKPEGAAQFRKGERGCVMEMFARSALGETVAFDRETIGCPGGATGLGFGNWYERFPGGLEGFYYFLSVGFENWDRGREIARRLKAEGVVQDKIVEKIVHGERYKKTPDLVKKFVEGLPVVNVPKKYVVFKPMRNVGGGDEPVVVVFTVNPHQLSALIVLANYDRDSCDNVVAPMGAGCHQIGIYAYREAFSEKPRAVIGLTDLDARMNVRSRLGDDVFTFAVPYRMFVSMEKNVEGSFLEVGTWNEVKKYLDA